VRAFTWVGRSRAWWAAPSLYGVLVLVATVAAAMMAAVVAVTATLEVALPRWGDAMAMNDGDGATLYAANNAGTGVSVEEFRGAAGHRHCTCHGRGHFWRWVCWRG